MTRRELIEKSIKLFPKSGYMRRQWVRKTEYLYATGSHILLTGKFIRKH